MLVLDSGALSRLSERTTQAVAIIQALRSAGLWPPFVPTPVLVESLLGDPGKDARANAFLKTCEIVDSFPVRLARRAAYLRTQSGRGSAVDALVVALAEPNGSVLTSDLNDLGSLALHATNVRIERI